MDWPVILARCTPDEFVNPYPALFWSAAACAALLSLDAFALFWIARRFYQARQIPWLNRMRQVINTLTLGAALLVLVLAAWLGWQSLHFVTFCSVGISLQYRAFQAGQAAVMVVIWVTALFLVGGLALLLSQFWQSKTMQRAR